MFLLMSNIKIFLHLLSVKSLKKTSKSLKTESALLNCYQFSTFLPYLHIVTTRGRCFIFEKAQELAIVQN